ncbi:MAG: hypothetical protein WCV84_00275 [Patescibacteria group bacterium]
MFYQLLVETDPLPALTPANSLGWSVSMAVGIVLIAIVLCGILMIVLRRAFQFLRRPDVHGLDPDRVKETWHQIEQTSQQGVMGAKMAIIEADKLLDGVLKAMFIPGETLGERLKVACYKYKNLQKVWGAHKLRNQLVHDTSFEISMPQARAALNDFRSALRLLGML